jgi:hypothetical protein
MMTIVKHFTKVNWDEIYTSSRFFWHGSSLPCQKIA